MEKTVSEQEFAAEVPVFRSQVPPPNMVLPNPRHIVILDQGAEPASVGFALAGTVNYLRRERGERDLVSPRFLYEMARRYAGLGEYEEGAYLWSGIYGLVHDGVCLEEQWPYVPDDSGVPSEAVREAAREIVPEGVESIADCRDLKAAVHDAHAAVVAANIHERWANVEHGAIPLDDTFWGIHAFVVIGYTEEGFLVQNSWGSEWGGVELQGQAFPGCAIWTYEDCERNYAEGWVIRFAGEVVPAREAVRRAGYRPDVVEGRDKLELIHEVESLAMIIASRDVEPPLAVGLFGDWGVGKTFFMKELKGRLSDISKHAKEIEERRGEKGYATEPSFWSDICQIDFNAWHFLDQNLWASVVVRIFDGLAHHIADDSDSIHAQRAALLDTIEARDDEIAQLRERQESLSHEIEQQRARLAQLDEQAKQERQDLDLADARTIIVRAWNEKTREPELNRAARELGIPSTIESASELTSSAADVLSLVGRLRLRFAALIGQGRPLLRLGLVTVIVGLGILVGWGVQALLAGESYQGVAAEIAKWATWISGTAAGARVLLEKVNGYLEQVEDAFEVIEDKASEPTLDAERKKHQERLEKILTDRAAVEHETREKKAAIANLERAIDDLRVGRRLYDYIQRKADSSTYREHLGIVSSVRHDLETLSDLLGENSQEKRKKWVDMNTSKPDAAGGSGHDEPTPSNDGDKSRTLTDDAVLEGEDHERQVASVDRIVLYVDDLDRCPPDRVVEVLQAIHLLLAFKLFVVVVAVDPRWLLRSLERQYPDFLELDRGVLGGEGISRWASTPQSYLEKIFQIPFTIGPMSDVGYRQLVDDLVQSAITHEDRERGEPSTDSPPDQRIGKPPSGSDLRGRVALKRVPHTPTTVTRWPVDPNPPSLDITEDEVGLMYALHGMLGTPRSLKRFVNTYRLVRAGLSPKELHEFEKPGSEDPDAVILLLGILTGTPQEAPWIFHGLDRSSNSDSWSEFVDGLEPRAASESSIATEEPPATNSKQRYKNDLCPHIEAAVVPRWRRIHLVLKRPEIPDFETLAPTRKWVRRVARCAFYPFRFETMRDDRSDP